MEKYEELDMQIVFFSESDVIVCSPETGEEFTITT